MEHAIRSAPAAVFILTGDPGSGKSNYLARLAKCLKQDGIRVTGILAPCTDRGSRAYALLDAGTGRTLPLSTGQFVGHWEKAGAFYFNPAALALGRSILMDPGNTREDLLILDEVGPFELSGRIWAGALGKLLENPGTALLIVVRRSLVEAVVSKWKLPSPLIIDIDADPLDSAHDIIRSQLSSPGRK